MAGVTKTVYRVARSFGHDVAMICEVRDGDVNGGSIRETRDRRIVLGGVDSFWLVTGEKKEQKPVIERDETPPLLPHFSAISSLAAPIPANAGFNLRFGQIGAAVRRDAVSFVSATRLSVAYSSRDITHEDVVARLREGVLAIPTKNDVIAIEVRAGSWLTTQFERNSSNLYGLSPSTSMRSISVSTLENRPETIKLSSGLVLYITPPKWSPGREIDLRSENEIIQAAEYWLNRATSVAGVQSASGSRLIDLFRQYMSSTVSVEEQADLSAVVGLLSGRQPLIEMMSKMLAREPAFQERIRKFEQSEKARLSTDIRSQLEAEIQSEQARLSEIRANIADAETKLALASHREILLRREAEKHDDSIRAKITEAARALNREASRDSNQLREELDGLRDRVSELARPAECPAEVAAASEKTHKEDHSGHMVFADHDTCKSIIGGLSSATRMPQADVATIILWSTENIPVLIGSNSSAAAVDIAAAIGGEDSAIVFCDPSRISLQDLLRDETSGLAAAVAKARACPQMLVPVAVCGITNGPCEYWVPHLIEARRLGKMPRNLAVIASAGIDGMRVPVPDSVLGSFAPFMVPASSKPGRNLFAGAWRVDLEVSRKRLAEALELLSQSDSLENGALQRLARILARTPIGIDMNEVASALQRHHEWLTSLSRQGQQHEFKSYFTNVGE